MSDWLYGIVFPPVFFMIVGVVFSGTADTSQIDSTRVTLFCDFPDYTLGGNSTGNGCLTTDAYSNDSVVLWSVGFNFFSENSTNVWEASLPTGWFTYPADVLTVGFYKVGAIFYYVPALIFTYTMPSDFSDFIAFWGLINSILWGIFFVSVYKVVSPLVS